MDDNCASLFFRSLKREMRSLALLETSCLPRSLSAGPSRSNDKNLASLDPLEIEWKKLARRKKLDLPKYQAFLTRELQFGKDDNMSTTVKPIQFFSDNLSSSARGKVSIWI